MSRALAPAHDGAERGIDVGPVSAPLRWPDCRGAVLAYGSLSWHVVALAGGLVTLRRVGSDDTATESMTLDDAREMLRSGWTLTIPRR